MFGRRGRKRKATDLRKGNISRCQQCGGEIKLDEDSGAQVCSSCGNIVVQASQEVVEVNTQNLARSRGSVIQRKVPKRKPPAAKTAPALSSGSKQDRLFALEDKHVAVSERRYITPSAFRLLTKPDYTSVAMAMDLLVDATCTALRVKVNLPDREVRRLQTVWKQYKLKIMQDGVSVARCFGNLQYRLSLGQKAPTPSVILPIVVLVLRSTTRPILVWDVLEMYRSGTLPLSDSLAIFPQKLRDRLRAVTSLFRKMKVQNLLVLHEKTEALAAYLEMPYSRKLGHQNELVVAVRFIRRLGLMPVKVVWPYVLNLYVNRHNKEEMNDVVDIGAMLAAAISCVPGWWDTYVIEPHKKSKDPAKSCFEAATSCNNLVYAGKVECFSNLDRMHQLFDKKEFWRYMDYLGTNMSAKTEVPNGIDKHLACFEKASTGMFTIAPEPTPVSSHSPPESKQLSAESEQALEALVQDLTITSYSRKGCATQVFTSGGYLQARTKWVGTSRISRLVVKGSFAIPRYGSLAIECQWLLDLFGTVFNLCAEDRTRLLATTVRNFFFKKPPSDAKKHVKALVTANTTMIKKIKKAPRLYEHIYDWKSPQSSSSSSTSSSATATAPP